MAAAVSLGVRIFRPRRDTLPSLLGDAKAALASLSDDDQAWIFGEDRADAVPSARYVLRSSPWLSNSIKLAVRNVRKSFRIRGRREADDRILSVLGDVSFDVRQGEIVSIIGESGCGKTTLLKIVQGLIRSDGGSIVVDGEPVTKPGRDRGFVFQHASLLPWRTAAQNVQFGLELQGMPRPRARSRLGDF